LETRNYQPLYQWACKKVKLINHQSQLARLEKGLGLTNHQSTSTQLGLLKKDYR
jgi:hypothetical protein